MPLYEYRCQSCSAVFELLRPVVDRELAAVCPTCEGRTTMPLISRVALHATAPAGGPAPGATALRRRLRQLLRLSLTGAAAPARGAPPRPRCPARLRWAARSRPRPP